MCIIDVSKRKIHSHNSQDAQLFRQKHVHQTLGLSQVFSPNVPFSLKPNMFFQTPHLPKAIKDPCQNVSFPDKTELERGWFDSIHAYRHDRDVLTYGPMDQKGSKRNSTCCRWLSLVPSSSWNPGHLECRAFSCVRCIYNKLLKMKVIALCVNWPGPQSFWRLHGLRMSKLEMCVCVLIEN